MSIRPGVTTVVATLLFWPASSLRAGENKGPLTTFASPAHPDPTRFADVFRQAPIGHRQPRPGGMSDPLQVSPVDVTQRRVDAEIDRKLIICRGC